MFSPSSPLFLAFSAFISSLVFSVIFSAIASSNSFSSCILSATSASEYESFVSFNTCSPVFFSASSPFPALSGVSPASGRAPSCALPCVPSLFAPSRRGAGGARGAGRTFKRPGATIPHLQTPPDAQRNDDAAASAAPAAAAAAAAAVAMVHRYEVRALGHDDDPKACKCATLPLPGDDLPNDTEDLIKSRYVFGVLGILGIATLYALRVNLSVAIVTMVNHTALPEPPDYDNDTLDDDTCPGAVIEPHTRLSGEFIWDEERQGLMLAAFFWGYAAGQLPGGLLAERFGGKLVFGLGVFLTAVLTVASPFLLWINDWCFFVTRLLEGLFEGVTFPAIQFMIAKWSPPNERSRFSMIFSGSYVGTVITMPLSGYLSDSTLFGGWPLVFYVTGALGVLWYIPWLICVFDSPAVHPRISEAERNYIEATQGKAGLKKKLPIPWKEILSSPGLWACASMHLGIGWNFFGQITYLPSFMSEMLHYKIENNAILSAIPYVVGGISSFASTFILDWLITEKKVHPLTGYKIFNGITGLGAAITLALLPFAGCHRIWINILLALNGICLGAQYAGNGTNLLVIAPNFAGTMYGISNTMANAAGILAPYAVGFLTYGNQTRSAWNTMFYISSAIGAATFLIYLLLCTADEASWNNPPPLGEETAEENNEHQNEVNNKSHVNKAYELDCP